MKKFTSILLAVLVVLSIFTFGASAATPSLTAAADKVTVKEGDVITVTVKLSRDSYLTSLVAKLGYNTEAFEVVSTATGRLFSNAAVNTGEAGKVEFNGTSDLPVTSSGTLLVVSFRALKAIDSMILLDVAQAYVSDPELGDYDATFTVMTKDVKIKSDDVADSEQCVKHSYSNYAVTKVPTCVEKGEQTANCNICGAEKTKPVPATGVHIAKDKWEIVQKASILRDGKKVLKCKYCDIVMETKIIPQAQSNGNLYSPII
ncbi:MAG: hypothetical protein IIW72_04000, partial [Clostridia bacterium]|nr:hypothetical protein [Clostridia bacterium]